MPLKHGGLAEIVFGTSNKAENNRIARLVAAKRLKQLGPRLYTSSVDGDPAAVMRRNWHTIAGRLFQGAVVSHRTALENGPAADGTICLTWSGPRRTATGYPGIVFRVFKGSGPLPGDTPFIGGLYLASRPRALLENLRQSRSRNKRLPATLGRAGVEKILDRDYRIHGVERLKRLRVEADQLATTLGARAEYNLLDDIVGMIAGTRSGKPASDVVRARLQGQPYDPQSLERFEKLRAFLAKVDFPAVLDPAPAGRAWRHFAFFDAYFSNYIEGTEFEIEEAYEIVFEGKIPSGRPQDAKDVIGTYCVLADQEEMSRGIVDAAAFIDVLKARNYSVMNSRPDKEPGEFKAVRNRVGDTYFVDPELVVGTLTKGFELLESLRQPFSRAAFIKYVTVDVHPFLDGNGRTARIMMNAELVRAGEARILIPSVYRDNYIGAVARMRREGDPLAYVKVLEYARMFSASLAYSDYDVTVAAMRALHAFKKSGEERLRLPAGIVFQSAIPPGT